MHKILKKDQFYQLIGRLLKEFEIIGPKELSNKGIFYQPVMKLEDLYLGEDFTIEPIKKFFLSPAEWLFKERLEDRTDILKDVTPPTNRRIVIGVRPCEVKGLMLLDKVFDSEYKDAFYINNRNRTSIVSLACSKPHRDCFCTSMGGSPVGTAGLDVLIFDNRDGFVIEIITDQGGKIFGSLGEELNEDQKKSLEASKKERENSVKKKIKVPEALGEIFESDYWERVSQPCISCGICTYLCPTCHCFDLIDEERKRLRCYDGCAFKDFTLQASGENPRPSKKERYRQRAYHKFDYFKKNFGENLCVGCGRCIRHCPVKMDISEIADKVPI